MIKHAEIHELYSSMQRPVLSLYLHVDAGYQQNQSNKPAWEIYLKNALSDAAEQAKKEHAEAWSAIEARVETFLNDYEVSSKTLVLFASPDDTVAYDLPVTLENNHAFGEPLLTPLIWALDEYEEYLIAFVDQEKARFISTYLGRANQQGDMHIDLNYDWRERTLMPASSGDGRALREGSNREAFEDMIDAHVDRFYQDVADQLSELVEESGITRFILAGNERAAHQVSDKLHESVAKYQIAIHPTDYNATDEQVTDMVLEIGTEHERQQESQLVDEIIGFAKAEGRGALGKDAVERAFEMQQVELLVLPFPPEDEALASELTLKAMQANSHVELVHGEPADKLREEGNMAARLYYVPVSS